MSDALHGSPGAPPAPRVLLVCDWFLKYVVPFAEALRREGAEVALLCRDHASEFESDHGERQALLDRVRSAGATVIELRGSAKHLGREARSAIGEVRRWRADLAHAQSELRDARLLLAVTGLPTVLMVHDPEPHLGAAALRPHHRLLERLWRRRADLLLVHGRSLARSLRTKRPVRVLPHGMSPREAPVPAPDKPVVLLFGRLEYYKGVRVLLEAMEIVWARRPEVRLVIAGKGPESNAVPDDTRIDFLPGYLPENEVDGLFARASLVALPYLDASQSGVGLLALGRGIPVVVTDAGDLRDLVPNDSFVARAGDATSLADAILANLDQPTSARADELARTRAIFGWDAVARSALGIYSDLLDSRLHT